MLDKFGGDISRLDNMTTMTEHVQDDNGNWVTKTRNLSKAERKFTKKIQAQLKKLLEE